jgi:hypothetical protein
MTPSNETRSERAENALKAYVRAKGEVFENSRSEIADLIVDLLHLLATEHAAEAPSTADDVIQSTLDLARMHFEAEQADAEEEGGPQLCLSLNTAPPPAELIYMPDESTPTVATLGNREAIAYMELGERTDYYGRLFAKAPEIRERLLRIKRLTESADDNGYDPYALLTLIAQEARAAIASISDADRSD